MAGIYLFYLLVFFLMIGGYRRTSLLLGIAGILLSLLMFVHHATDVLKINW